MPTPEHHRERLLNRGASSLTDAELLATLIRTGTKHQSALESAQGLLNEPGGLRTLLNTDGHHLRAQGFGATKSAPILAALEIARRLARVDIVDKWLLDQPAAVAAYVSLNYLKPDQEVTGCLYLDTRNRLIADDELFRGTITRTSVEPRAILKEALTYSATGFILFHGHPSGDPSPSPQDRRFTRRLADAGELMGIRLVDHVIVGTAGEWVSMQRKGGW